MPTEWNHNGWAHLFRYNCLCALFFAFNVTLEKNFRVICSVYTFEEGVVAEHLKLKQNNDQERKQKNYRKITEMFFLLF